MIKGDVEMRKIMSFVIALAAALSITASASASESTADDIGVMDATQCVRMSGPSSLNQACIKVEGSSLWVDRISGGMQVGPGVQMLCDVKIEIFGILNSGGDYYRQGIAPCKANLTYHEEFPKTSFRQDSLLCAKATYPGLPTSQPTCIRILR
ncbi:hypothetical protein LFM09_41830 [Lentzea alba]|uniref:hypothetical protein n=1 Tax=Lentzea alba TaxID=2714351 RepID=UPI0039BF7678